MSLIPVVIMVSFIVFALVELAPGDIVDSLRSGEMTAEEVAELREQYNLNKPMIYRYGLYMLNLIQGDLGVSQASGQPVFRSYMSRLPNTLLLSFAATLIGTVTAIPIGIRAARKAGTVTDTATTSFSLIGMSMPTFWLGLLLMLLFSLYLDWLPAGGNRDGIRSLILPAVCSAMTLMAVCARQTRSSMLEVLKADYLRTARAKGVPEKIVIRKHALGNALIPVITSVGSLVCVQLAGSVVVEQVFAWPGVGRMLIEGVTKRDVTVVTGCVIMTTILYVLVMLIVDLLYAFVDPRIKSQYVRKLRKKRTSTETVFEDKTHSRNTSESKDAFVDVLESSDYHIPKIESNLLEASCCYSEDVTESGSCECVTRHNGITEENTSSSDDVAEIIARYKKRSRLGEIWHRLVHNKSSLAGIIILGFIFSLAIISLFMSYESVTSSHVSIRLSPPSWQYPFGTDNMGRSTFLRVIYGSRYSIIIGFSAIAFAALFGIILGATAGYYGGMIENVIMRISDILASLPGILLGMVIMLVLGMKLQNLIIAVGITSIPNFLRMSRAMVLTIKSNEFVESARAVGYSSFRILLTQILPNGLSPLIVQATTLLGISITVAAALSFLGFGVQAPTPEWGALIAAGRQVARTAPWMMAFPGLAIMITVLGFNLLGDGLRDALDPKLKK